MKAIPWQAFLKQEVCHYYTFSLSITLQKSFFVYLSDNPDLECCCENLWLLHLNEYNRTTVFHFLGLDSAMQNLYDQLWVDCYRLKCIQTFNPCSYRTSLRMPAVCREIARSTCYDIVAEQQRQLNRALSMFGCLKLLNACEKASFTTGWRGCISKLHAHTSTLKQTTSYATYTSAETARLSCAQSLNCKRTQRALIYEFPSYSNTSISAPTTQQTTVSSSNCTLKSLARHQITWASSPVSLIIHTRPQSIWRRSSYAVRLHCQTLATCRRTKVRNGKFS